MSAAAVASSTPAAAPSPSSSLSSSAIVASPPRRALTAHFDSDSVIVYQAFNPSLAAGAVKLQRFAGADGFLPGRMTWIKFSLGWMIHRCSYAEARNQERVLSIRLRREGLESILREAVPSSWEQARGFYRTQEEWRAAMQQRCVRLQWDPERDVFDRRVPGLRAAQLGLGGDIGRRYASGEWIESITDVTPLVRAIKHSIDTGAPMPTLPVEREMEVADRELRCALGMEELLPLAADDEEEQSQAQRASEGADS